MQVIGHFIQGKLITDGDSYQDVYNPATANVEKKVLIASKEHLQQAIDSAKEAYLSWRQVPAAQRAQVMFKFKLLLEENQSRICELIGSEHGKVMADAIGELQRGIENVEYACAAPELLKGEYNRQVGIGIDTWSEFQPLGVVAGITPFNFPAMVPLWMFPMAIVCGNTFILKPSEKDPSTPLFLAQLLQQAGLPDGVFNVVNGDKTAVDTLICDPNVQAISFVGSTPVAEYIYQTASQYGKRCQALGGAKNHALVLPDADINNAASQLIGAAFGSSGERCMALSVAIVIGNDTGDKLVKSLQNAMRGLQAGHYQDEDKHFGPLISSEHQQKVIDYIDSAEQDGAQLLVDGRHILVEGYPNGFFVGATLIDYVKPFMKSYQEEIFGPVLQIIRVETVEEAMKLINDHQYGNGTCIFTRDGEAARYFSEHIHVGMVGINIPLPVPVAYHSFGGWKRSLFGDLHAYGPDAVRFYTKRKTITQRWPSSQVREKASFSMPIIK